MNLKRLVFLSIGVLIVLFGIMLIPVPGPGGLPVIVIGLLIILPNSPWARRKFVEWAKRHPKLMSPVQYLIRRSVAWKARSERKKMGA